MLAHLWLTQTHRITYNHIGNEDDNDDDNDDNNERDGDNDDDYVKDNDDSGKVIFMMIYIIITKTIFDELYKHNEWYCRCNRWNINGIKSIQKRK